MSSSDSEILTPDSIKDEANCVIQNLLPEISKARYINTYNDFMKWRAEKCIEDSVQNKTKISTKLTETIKIRPNSPQPSTSREYPPCNPSSDEIPESPTFTEIQNSQICHNISNSINISNKNISFNFTNCPNLTINFK